MTAKQRAEIYRKALMDISNPACAMPYVCISLKHASLNKSLYRCLVSVLDIFPEFALFEPEEPEGARRFNTQWWCSKDRSRDLNCRITCLLFCEQMALDTYNKEKEKK